MLNLLLRMSPLLVYALGLAACLPGPKSETEKSNPSLTLSGQVLSSDGQPAGQTAIYIEQFSAPELLSSSDGSFTLSFDAKRLNQLRLQYGLQKQPLRIYFVNERNNSESTVMQVLELTARGERSLGRVILQTEVLISGQVLALSKADGSLQPIAAARVLLGRKALVTDGDGKFSGTAPMNTMSPVTIEKKGFVQTLGECLPGEGVQEFRLFDSLIPTGSIAVTPSGLESFNPSFVLNYSANSTAQWVRFASSPELLQKTFEVSSPWMDFSQALKANFSKGSTIYYQFTDRDKKVLGPISSYTFL